MVDYKAMYIHLFQQVERAVRILQQAQLDCEDMYINSPESELLLLNGADQPEPEQTGDAEDLEERAPEAELSSGTLL